MSDNRKSTSVELITYLKHNALEIRNLIRGATVEIIEVKYDLNRLVIGRAIVGADFLMMAYRPKQISSDKVCEEGDPLHEVVCVRDSA